MMPQPPGSDSACRAGKGFQISNNLKSIKPSSRYFQLSTEFSVMKPSAESVDTAGAALHHDQPTLFEDRNDGVETRDFDGNAHGEARKLVGLTRRGVHFGMLRDFR